MAITLGAADTKAEIVRGYDQESMRKKVVPNIEGMNDDTIVDMGNELEKTTQTKGWLIIESWIVHDANPQVLLQLTTERERGIVEGEMRLMQRIKAIISNRDDILKKQREKEEADKKENA